MPDLSQFDGQDFLTLETFRRSGIGVKTPIWLVRGGDALWMWTMAGSGKVKRIQPTPRHARACGYPRLPCFPPPADGSAK